MSTEIIAKFNQKIVSFEALENLGISKSYAAAYSHFTKWLTENKKQRNGDSIKEYLLEEKENGKQAATLQHKKSFLKSWALLELELSGADENDKKMVRDFFNTIKLPKPDSKLQDYQFLTDSEIKVLLQYASKRMGLIIETIQQCGIRVSELINIRIKECRKLGNFLVVNIFGKGSKIRKVPITYDLYSRICEVFKGNEFLFESKSGNRLDRKNIHKQIKSTGWKASKGVSDKYLASKLDMVHPHSLRHSFASNSLDSGIDIYSVQQILGHSMLQTTERYLHNRPDHQKILERFMEAKA